MTSDGLTAGQPDLITEWFCAHGEDDGDFICCDASHPLLQIRKSDGANRIIYATKNSVVAAAAASLSSACKLDIVACCGLPTEDDISRIAEVARGREIMFLGDMDPADLMIFGWLRTRLVPLQVRHLGINDTYVAQLNACIPPTYRIALKQTERASLSVLKAAVSDVEDVVGEECWQLLGQGYKIEVEAIVSALGSANLVLLPALR